MCTRTKTSYGCGHIHKTTIGCRDRHCVGLERFHYQRDGDCLECKRGGRLVTRGRAGEGRYAQALKKRDAISSTSRSPLSSISGNAFPSPWIVTGDAEMEKRSPIREEADHAWLREHEKRQRDLERRSAASSPSPSLLDSPKAHKWQDDYSAAVYGEMARIESSEKIRIRRQRGRADSYDSFPDSFGGSRGSQGSSGSRSRRHGYDSAYVPTSDPYSSRLPPSSSHHRSGHGMGDIMRDGRQLWKRW